VNEKPDTIHGRLLEAVHISGYSFERACKEFVWLLEDNHWQQCGEGFERIDDFLETISFGDYKIAAEQRKDISKKLSELRATQRAIAGTLGVSQETIRRDIVPDTNVSKPESQIEEYKEIGKTTDTNVSKPPSNKSGPSIIEKNGAEIIKLAERKAHVGHNTGENEWYTPVKIIEASKKVLGHIDLDPASTDEANAIIQAESIFTIADNGLEKDWCGNIWMNPPYASDLIGKFTNKLLEQLSLGNVTSAIVLVNNATETKWFQPMMLMCNAICFPEGRVHFWSTTKETATPLQGQAILYFGSSVDSFKDNFSIFGAILYG